MFLIGRQNRDPLTYKNSPIFELKLKDRYILSYFRNYLLIRVIFDVKYGFLLFADIFRVQIILRKMSDDNRRIKLFVGNLADIF